MWDKIASAGIGALGSVFSGILGNNSAESNAREQREWQSKENEINRTWQSGESDKARQWEEQMYNLYNSPSAMKKQLSEAGLNPWLSGSDSVGSSMSSSAPMSGSPAVGSGVAAQTVPYPDIGQSITQALGVNAQIGNQKSQEFKNVLDAIVKAYPTLGKEGTQKLLDTYLPLLNGVDPNEGILFKEARSKIYNLDMDSLYKDFLYTSGKDYTPQQKTLEFQKLAAETQQLIKSASLMSSQEDVNRSQVRVNDAELKNIASQIARNFADAYNLQKQGDYYVCSAQQMTFINQMLDLQLQEAQADFAFNTSVRKYKKEIPNRSQALGLFLGSLGAQSTSLSLEGNSFLRYGKAVTSMVGDLFKVNFGFSNNNTNFLNRTPQNNTQMFYSGDGYYMNNGNLIKGSW